MHVEFNKKTLQLVTKYFSLDAPELSFTDVKNIKSHIMIEEIYKHEDFNDVVYFFSFEKNNKYNLVKISIICDIFKSSYLFFQDSLFQAIDDIAIFYDSVNNETEESSNCETEESSNCETEESSNCETEESSNCETEESLECETEESSNCEIKKK
jgi:hypothetical protein